MTESVMWSGWSRAMKKKSEKLGDKARSHERHRRRRKCWVHALEILKTEAPGLYSGEQNADYNPTEMNQLFEKLKGHASNQDYRDRHNYIVEGLHRGARELAWQIEVPSMIQIYHSPKAPLSVQGQRQGVSYRRLLTMSNEHFGDILLEPASSDSKTESLQAREAEAGRLLFSAITRGGILNAGWLTALPDALHRGVWVDEKSISLELQMSDVDSYRFKVDFSKSESRRRWFPDPVTAMLLLRWYKKYGRAWPESKGPVFRQIDVLLDAYFRSLSLPKTLELPKVDHKGGRPRISRWLQEHACREAAKDFPGYLVHFASSLEVGASVPREAWLRLQTGLIAKDISRSLPADNSVPSVTIGGDQPLPSSEQSGQRVAKDHQQTLNALRLCLTHRRYDLGAERSVPNAIEALKRFVAEPKYRSPILSLVAHWLLSRLRSESALNAKRIKPASALRYLGTVGRPLLVASLQNPDVEHYDADDWIELYEKAICFDLSSESKATRRQRLSEFHAWLVGHYMVPPVDIVEEGVSVRNVDANLLTPREYTRAKSWLMALENSRQSVICSLVLTIGFRCGLRRREVTHLRLQDLEGLGEPGFNKPSLRVMNQRGMTHKSQSAVRRLPIWLLLMEAEINELKRWLHTRIAELGGSLPPNALLFSMEGRPAEIINDTYVFKPVTRAMRTASGDNNLRFHHNRHAFATFMGLRMLESYPGQFLPDPWVTEDSGEPLLPYWGEDFSQLASLGSAQSPTQKHLWELCTWCGHLTPGETMSSYSHLFDWVLRRYLAERRNPELTLAQQAQLVGVSATGIERLRNRHHLRGTHRAGDILAALANRWKPFAIKARLEKRVLATAPEFEESDRNAATGTSPLVLYEMLKNLEKLFERDTEPYLKIADTYALPERLVREWASRAELLSQAQTYRKTPILRFYRTLPRKPRVLPKSRPDHAPSSEIFIAPPREKDLRARSEQLYKRLVELFENDPDLVLGMLSSSLKAFQRTKVALKFEDLEDRRKFLTILDSVGLKSWTFVHLKLAPGMDEQRAKTHWSDVFDVDKSRIKIKRGPEDEVKPFPLGSAHPDFFADKTGLRSTWTVVKFVLAAAIIMLPSIEMSGGVL